MRFSDKVIGIAVTVLGLLVLYLSRSFRSFQHIEYGPGFFPSLIGGGLMLAGMVMIGSTYYRHDNAKHIAVGAWVRSPKHLGNILVFLGSIVFYILVSEILGFILTAFLLLFVMLFWFWRRLWGSVVIALLGVILSHVVFQEILRVPLPWGILEAYAGYLTWR